MPAPLLDGYLVHVVARYGLEANVPTLLTGEFGYDTDTKTLRVGDDTSSPSRLMTTKSTGSFDFSTVTQITLPGGTPVTSDGKVDGVDISSLNQSNGLLVRTGSGTFNNTTMVSGDNTILITNPTGVLAGGIDVRLNPNVSFIPDGDKGDIVVTNLGTQWNIDTGVVTNTHLAIMPAIGLKGTLTGGAAVSDLTPVQVADMLPLFGTITKGVVPPYTSVQGRVLSDTGWVSPGELFGRLDGKESVRCTASVDVNMAGTVVPIDGITLANGTTTRVGLVGQTVGSQNGIYDVSVSGTSWTWVRSSDANSDAEVTAGMSFWSSEGTENSDCVWYLTTNDPIVLGSTALTFIKADYGANFVRKTGDTMSGTLYNNSASGATSTGCFRGTLDPSNITQTYALQGYSMATVTNTSAAVRGWAVAVAFPGANGVQGVLGYAGKYSFFGDGTFLNRGPLEIQTHAQFGTGLIEFPDGTQQFTAFTANTYVRKTGDSMSGSLTVTATPSTYAVVGAASSSSYGGVYGQAVNTSVYGILGHSDTYSFYGNGQLANLSGHIRVGTAGYGVQFADNTIQYTAARGAYAREDWVWTSGTSMSLRASTNALPNPAFGLPQRVSGISFGGAINSISNGPQPTFTATFTSAFPNTSYIIKGTVYSSQTIESSVEYYSLPITITTKTTSGFSGTFPSITGVIYSIVFEIEHFTA
jgi:hypothetical protein